MESKNSNYPSDVSMDKTTSSSDNYDEINFKDCIETLPETSELPPEVTNDDESEEEYSDAPEGEEIDLNESEMEEMYKNLSENDLLKYKEEGILLKNNGNEYFKKTDYKEAVKLYTQGLNICPLKYQLERAVLYANRAAAKINLNKNEEAVLDCNKAIECNPEYLKAIIRRAQVHRKLDSLERALEDYQRILELDKTNEEARQACRRLPAEIEEKNEKLKQEMFGKLKELGNMCLKPFGLSTENFNVVQDTNTGGYSINFQNNN